MKVSNTRQITEDEFEDNYVIVDDHLETDSDINFINAMIGQRRLWTFGETDGTYWIASGYHPVNQLYYIVTAVPYQDDEELLVVLDI